MLWGWGREVLCEHLGMCCDLLDACEHNLQSLLRCCHRAGFCDVSAHLGFWICMASAVCMNHHPPNMQACSVCVRLSVRMAEKELTNPTAPATYHTLWEVTNQEGIPMLELC